MAQESGMIKTMSAQLLTILPKDLVAMDTMGDETPLRIDLVYAQAAHPENIFKQALYRPQARLWLHREFAAVVALAAERCYAETGLVFVLKDGLRPVEAQMLMRETAIVKANPHWLKNPTIRRAKAAKVYPYPHPPRP